MLGVFEDELRQIDSKMAGGDWNDIPRLFARIPLEVFGELTLRRTNKYPNIETFLPTMPSEQVQDDWTGTHGEALLRQSLVFVRTLVGGFSALTGLPLGRAPILDFGCGWGRIIRLLYKFAPADNIYGVDPWDKSLDLCREHGVKGHLAVSEWIPSSLPFQRKFDLIFAFSVFTHLSQRTTAAVLGTLRKHITGRGVLVISIRPQEYWSDHPDRVLGEEMISRHEGVGFAFQPHNRPPIDGDITYGDTSLSLTYLKANFPEWSLESVEHNSEDPHQLILFLKPRADDVFRAVSRLGRDLSEKWTALWRRMSSEWTRPQQRTRLAGRAWALLFAVPFALFGFFTYRYAVNIPMFDDYDLVLRNTNAFLTAPSLGEKLGVFFRQQNEHRLLLDKVMLLAQYLISGRVNFRGLIFAGNMGYALLVLLFCYQLHKLGLNRLQVLPVPYLLLAFTHYENMLFATPSIQYYWGALLALLFLVSLLRAQGILAACLAYVLGIYTMGGNLVLLPLGLVVLAVQRRWRHALAFLPVGVAFTLIYFYHYQANPFQPSLEASFTHFDEAILFFFTLLGNSLLSSNVAAIVGVAIAVLLAFIAIHPRHQLLQLVSAWILLTAGAIAVTRAGFGIEQALQSRYTMYSLIALASVYAWIVAREATRPGGRADLMALGALAVSAAFFFGVLLRYEARNQFEAERDRKIASTALYALAGDNTLLLFHDPATAAQDLIESRRLGTYDYKTTALQLQRPVELQQSLQPPNSAFQGNMDLQTASHVYGWAVIPGLRSSASRIYVLLENQIGSIKIEATKVERPDVSKAENTQFIYDYSGYDLFLAAYAVPSGTYRLGEMVQNGANIGVHWEASPVTMP